MDTNTVYHYGMAHTITLMVFSPGGSLRSWLDDACASGSISHVVMPVVPADLRSADGITNCIGIDQFCRQCIDSDHTPLPATELDVQMALWSSISVLPEDGFLRPACRYPGNIASLAHTMNELAKHQVSAASLRAVAESRPLDAVKLDELARISEKLTSVLKSQNRVLKGELWQMAAEHLENTPYSKDNRVCFAGFERAPYSFSRLIRACSNHGDVVLPVEGDLDRPQLFGSLHALIADLNETLTVDIQTQSVTAAATCSQWIVQNMGQPHVPPDDLPSDGHVHIVDAPSPLVETQMLARELVRKHRDGVEWSDMCLILPNMQETLPGYELILSRLGIPYQAPGGSLIDHPQVAMLLQLLRSMNSFSRDEALQLLRLGLMQIDIYEIERLRRAGRESGVKSGLMLLQLPSATDAPPWSDVLLKACLRLSEVIIKLQAVSEPVQLVELLKLITIEWNLVEPDSEEQNPVDLFIELAVGLIMHSGIDIHDIAEPLSQIVALASNPTPVTSDAVPIVSHLSAESRSYQFVAMPSLLEGVMPGSSREDPIIGDDLREALAHLLHRHLPLSHENSDIDRLHFISGIAKARDTLWLSCSRTVGDREALPSYLLSGILQVLPQDWYTLHERRLHEASYSVTEIVNESDWRLRLAERLYARDKEVRSPLASNEPGLLISLAKRAIKTEQVEMRLWTEWSEWPKLPKLLPQASRPVRREYAVTELQQMMQCRYRHFARWQLGLRSSNVSAMSIQGRWVHEVMRTAIQQHQQDVDTLLQEVVEQLPVDLHRGEQTLLCEDTGNMCAQILDREQRIYSQFGLTPTLYEVAFGRGDDPEETGGASPESNMKPLLLPLDDGHLRIAGRLDRVDVCARTGLAVLVDYKRSVPRDWFDRIAQGDDIQMPIYISALQNLFSLKVGAIAIDSGKSGVRYRILLQMNIDQEFQQRLWQQTDEGAASRVGTDMWWKIMYQNVAAKLKQSAALLASGDIIPTPGDWCSGCHFQHLCRTNMGATGPIHDGERYPAFG